MATKAPSSEAAAPLGQRGEDESAPTPPRQFATLIERARQLSHKAYVAPVEAALPDSYRNMDWSAYRNIRYRPERALWRGQPGHFEAQFFHLGFIYRIPVAIFVSQGVRTEPLPFSRDNFSYDGLTAPDSQLMLGYSGLRLHTNLNSSDHRDEIIVFQGASYLRSVGRGNALGLSARALSVDTGEPTREEFPRFSEIYLERPAAEDQSQWVLALIDAPRVAGAAAFRVTPGDNTVVDVSLQLFFRDKVAVLGLAPFSSMFLFGESEPHRFGNPHPEVHDSDGLVFLTQTGERVFRPLQNPLRTRVSNYRLDSPKGFGLAQRDRSSESYRDPELRYQDRPSAWVEPIGDWGKGQLRLLEFATPLDSDDNIATLWVPDHVPSEGLTLRYRISFGSDVEGARFGRAMQTRITGQGTQKAQLEVDFAVPDADSVAGPVTLELGAPSAQVLSSEVVRLPNGVFRARFALSRTDASHDTELRAFLRTGHDVLTETWSFPWQPNQ